MNLPTLKVYDIDYSFIIKNYLDPKMWQKKWVLFEYREHSFILQMLAIDTRKNRIDFALRKGRIPTYNWGADVEYYLDNSNIDFLKKSINRAILREIGLFERAVIKSTAEYCKIADKAEEIQEILIQQANDRLDDQGVYCEEIRNAYVERFLEDNDTSDDFLEDWLCNQEYKYATDMYLAYAQATNNDTLIKTVTSATSQTKVEEILQKLNDLQEKIENDELEYIRVSEDCYD